MEEQRQKIKERWPWFWTWRRLSSESAFWWSGLGRRTSVSKGRSCGCCCGYFEHQRRAQFEGCVAEQLQPITASLPGSKWSCLLLRIVLQDALSEVTQIYPPLKLRVFVHDITAQVKGRNKGGGKGKKKVMRKLKEEVQKEGLELSVTENGKEGKSKMIASCGYLENELRNFSREDGVSLADNVETLGVDLRTRVRRLSTSAM